MFSDGNTSWKALRKEKGILLHGLPPEQGLGSEVELPAEAGTQCLDRQRRRVKRF